MQCCYERDQIVELDVARDLKLEILRDGHYQLQAELQSLRVDVETALRASTHFGLEEAHSTPARALSEVFGSGNKKPLCGASLNVSPISKRSADDVLSAMSPFSDFSANKLDVLDDRGDENNPPSSISVKLSSQTIRPQGRSRILADLDVNCLTASSEKNLNFLSCSDVETEFEWYGDADQKVLDLRAPIGGCSAKLPLGPPPTRPVRGERLKAYRPLRD